jgi:hypothetical protein
MQQGRFRHDDMIHHPGAQPCGYVPTLVTRGVDQFCLAGMVWFWKALKGRSRSIHQGVVKLHGML